MITWRRQGAAAVGTLQLIDGRPANVVLVGARDNPRGAAVAVRRADTGAVETVPLAALYDALHPMDLTAVLCMQERVFGASPLPPPELDEAHAG